MGTTVIFTVPEGVSLRITSAQISGFGDSVNNQVVNFEIDQEVSIMVARMRSDTSIATSLTFPMPLKIDTGKILNLIQSQSGACSISFQGWLE